MEPKNNSEFFEWFVSLFKRKKPVVVEPSLEEIRKKEEYENIRRRYNVEYVESYNAYFVKYLDRNQWWYLRRWDEDYTLERVKGNAIRLAKPEHLESIIYQHQDWLKQGHIFMSFD